MDSRLSYFPGSGLHVASVKTHCEDAVRAFKMEHSGLNHLILYVHKAIEALNRSKDQYELLSIVQKLSGYLSTQRDIMIDARKKREKSQDAAIAMHDYLLSCLPQNINSPVPTTRILHLISGYIARTKSPEEAHCLLQEAGLSFLPVDSSKAMCLNQMLSEIDEGKIEHTFEWCEKKSVGCPRVGELMIKLLLANTFSSYSSDIINPLTLGDVIIKLPPLSEVLEMGKIARDVMRKAGLSKRNPTVEKLLRLLTISILASRKGDNIFGRFDVGPVSSLRTEVEGIYLSIEENNELRYEDILLSGIVALRTRICTPELSRKSHCPICELGNRLDTTLPFLQTEVSRIMDPITGNVNNDNNVPKCFNNGSVYLSQTINTSSRRGMFIDVLDNNRMFSVDDAKKLYFV